jgi:hypothetical protein
MAEEWRPMVGFQGVYSASSEGRIRRDLTITSAKAGKIMAQHKCKDGYWMVGLSINGRGRCRFVHRLVYEAFHGKLGPGLVVNHKDGDKSNARLNNLEAMTPSENIKHAFRVLGRRPTGQKLSLEQAREIRQRRADGQSLKTLAEHFEVTLSTISQIVQGKRWKHAGGPLQAVRAVKQRMTEVVSRISDDEVELIRGRVAAGETKAALATEYRVSKTTIKNWVTGKTRRPKPPRPREESDEGQLSLGLPV